jgi:hypothetical protein
LNFQASETVLATRQGQVEFGAQVMDPAGQQASLDDDGGAVYLVKNLRRRSRSVVRVRKVAEAGSPV